MLVVKGATTPRKVIADAKRRLQAVGARFLGAILNDVNVHGGDYQYYNRYYYSYYKHEGAVAAGQKGKEGWGDKVAGLMN
jgi:Mrp family chromosome partitioning ATPase